MDGLTFERIERVNPALNAIVTLDIVGYFYDEVVAIRREAWASTEIRTIARVTVPRGRTTWLVRDAVRAMEAADTDVLAVVDGDDRFVGVVTTEGVLRLDEILERTGERPGDRST